MTSAKTRMTAAEREAQIVRAAVTAFAASGYKGTTTDEVARLAGVSQPYVIRLFGGKQRLFLAALGHVCDQIERAFRHAAAGGDATLTDLGQAYDALLAERELLLVFLHGLATSSEPDIGAVVRPRFGRIVRTVRELTGASAEEVRQFVAKGLLITVLTAMRAIGPDAVAEPGLAELLDTFPRSHRPGHPEESGRA